nr:uncharacterized protein LOC129417603 isoform X1 [Misgurnus anguillicaudatus]
MSTSRDKLVKVTGARRLNISASAAGRMSFSLPGAIPEDEWSPPAVVRQSTILSDSTGEHVTGSSARGVQRRLNISAPAARRVWEDEKWSPEVVRQNTLSTSAHGLMTGSSARGVQRRSNIAAPAASYTRFTLPGAIEEEEEEEEECSPEVGRQNTILSTSAHGLVTGSGARGVQQRFNISRPAASHMRLAVLEAIEEEDEELSPEAHGLMAGSGERDTLSVSSSAADQESIVSSEDSEHNTTHTMDFSSRGESDEDGDDEDFSVAAPYPVDPANDTQVEPFGSRPTPNWSFTSRYEVLPNWLLGSGRTGRIFAAIRLSDGEQVAVKCVSKDKYNSRRSPGLRTPVPQEIAMMLELQRHPPLCSRMIRMHEWFEFPDGYIVVYEMLPHPWMRLDKFFEKTIGSARE